MAEKKFIDEFDVKFDERDYSVVKDYDAFQNKELLDHLRTEIIQNLIDNNLSSNGTMDEFIKTQIDKTLEGYDLSEVERSYIYNLIDNEINGFGPLSELLEDRVLLK